jgi:hypothetical protein
VTRRWPRWLRRHHYQAVIVGGESGAEHPLPFVQFRRQDDGLAWVAQMNAAAQTRWTHYELREIP